MKLHDYPEGEEDQISRLTHDVLVEILSFLTLKEAARTSVLSKRWVDLWKLLPNLEFDYGSMVKEILVEKKTYIQLVSKVLAQHKGPKVDKFRVCLQLMSTSNSGGDIERWVEFAISKGVERIDLDFNPEIPGMESDEDYEEDCDGYYSILRSRSFYQSGVLLGLSNVQYFRSLRLRYVYLTDVIFHHLVSCCHLLEKLVLDCCGGLVKANATALASSPSLPLKHLEIRSCYHLKEVEIYAPNLVSFCYNGGIVDLRMENVSSLKEMDLRNPDSDYGMVGYVSPYDYLLRHHSKFVRLETLTLQMNIDQMKPQHIRSVNEFPFLKHLTVYVESYHGLSDKYDRLVPLINACPSLHRLSLKVHSSTYSLLNQPYSDSCKSDPFFCLIWQSTLGDYEKPKHDYPFMLSAGGPWEEMQPSIKVLEITGFDTNSTDIFLDYVFHHFVMLEKLVINHRKWKPLFQEEVVPANAEAIVALCISHRRSLFPSTVEFVVL
ncbi:F-box/LRR-repeat protein 25 [Linum perenne]